MPTFGRYVSKLPEFYSCDRLIRRPYFVVEKSCGLESTIKLFHLGKVELGH